MTTNTTSSKKKIFDELKQKNQSELGRNILSAASTTSLCVGLLNPLDVLRVSWQTKPPTPPDLSPHAIVRDQLHSDLGLWKRGLDVNVATNFVQNRLRSYAGLWKRGLDVNVKTNLVQDQLRSDSKLWKRGLDVNVKTNPPTLDVSPRIFVKDQLHFDSGLRKRGLRLDVAKPTPVISLRAFMRDQFYSYPGLWKRGLGVNVASVGLSSGLRLGFYPSVRDALTDEPDSKTMFFAGFLAGACAFFVSTPFFNAKVQSQAFGYPPSGLTALKQIVQLGHAYKGASVLVVRGALLSGGFSLGYDGVKTQARTMGLREGPAIHVAGSVIAAFFATILSNPFDALMTRYQTVPHGTYASPLQCGLSMYREQGPSSFFRGWTFFFSRVAPLWIIQLPLYEQVRSRVFGIGYMR